jgi:hypothetical protein
MLASGVAVLLIVVMLFRSVEGRNEAARRREALLTTLERLAEAQEDALARDGRYASHLAPSGGVDTALFEPTPGLVFKFEPTGSASWRAVVRDTGLRNEPRSCGIYRGDAAASPHRAVVTPGRPACW